MELTPENVIAYLAEHGELTSTDAADGAVASILTGGVSNLALLVKSQSRSLVVKQALGKLNVKGEWRANPSRILREAAAIRAYSNVLEPVEAPGLLFVDPENFIIGIEEIQRPAEVWQSMIDGGVVTPGHARHAGKLLARMHSAIPSAEDAELLSSMEHVTELRIRPYFEHAALANPRWGERLALATERVLNVRSSLVHGDFAPKNIFVRGTAPYLTVLDFEVAHIGNPAFDLAFFLSHLVIDIHHSPALASDLLSAAHQLWSGYREEQGQTGAAQLERDTALMLPCLLLARVDGLSKVEYLSSGEADAVRSTAYRLFETNSECIHVSISEAAGLRELKAV